MGNGVSLSDLGSPTSFATLAIMFIWIIRTWPHWKAKVNEARKIQLDADEVLRNDLLKRIRELEEGQSADRREFHAAMSDERRRCDAELDTIREEMRQRLDTAEAERKGLLGAIRQNSESAAVMISRPDAAAESLAARRAREARKADDR